jgi:hypothetical protein
MSAATVWVMVISHRHGDDVSVFATRQGAVDCLATYVEDNWAYLFGADPMPDDVDVAITKWFDVVGDEHYTITETTVLP